MIHFRYISVVIFLCSFSSNANTIKGQNNAFRNFWHPTYLGERLDYCTVAGKECGKKVADRYCQMLGYNYSSQNVIAHNIGLTHYLLAKEHCSGSRCNGFMTITCTKNLSHTPPKPYHYREKSFVAPRFNGYRMDWCYGLNYGCGSRVADSFCNRMGFMRAKSFIKETQVSSTKTIGNQELCFGNQCNAFKLIICYR